MRILDSILNKIKNSWHEISTVFQDWFTQECAHAYRMFVTDSKTFFGLKYFLLSSPHLSSLDNNNFNDHIFLCYFFAAIFFIFVARVNEKSKKKKKKKSFEFNERVTQQTQMHMDMKEEVALNCNCIFTISLSALLIYFFFILTGSFKMHSQ